MTKKELENEIKDKHFRMVDFGWCDGISAGAEKQIVYKAAIVRKNGKIKPVIIELELPKKALRTYYKYPYAEKYGKHRCSFAKVIGFRSYYTGRPIKIDSARSLMYAFYYYKNQAVFPGDFNNSLMACSSGIHYFNNLESARCYADQTFMGNTSGVKLRKNSIYEYWVKKNRQGV